MIDLESFATPLKARNRFIKASFGGFQGSGKTRTATELIIGTYRKFEITEPLLIIDNEKGSRFLVPIFEQAGIRTLVKDTVSLADVLQAFQLLSAGKVGFLFIDSLSKIWYKYVRDYREKNRLVFMTLQDWGKILPSWQEQFSDAFVGLEGNCVFTGRGGYSYEKEEDEKDEVTGKVKKGQFVKSGVKMKMAGETPYEPDLNVWMDIQQELKDGQLTMYRTAQVLKDRSGIIDGKIFSNPTFKDFEPVLDFLKNVPTGTVAGTTSTKNLAPSEDWTAANRRTNREIALEEIQANFQLMNLGQTTDAKRLKVEILKSVFSEISWLAIEKLPVEQLQHGSMIIGEFSKRYQELKPDTYEEVMEYLNDAIKLSPVG